MDLELLNKYKDLLISGIAAIAWFIRLESKNENNNKDISRLENEISILKVKHDALSSSLVAELSELKAAVARVEGYLKATSEREWYDNG